MKILRGSELHVEVVRVVPGTSAGLMGEIAIGDKIMQIEGRRIEDICGGKHVSMSEAVKTVKQVKQ